LWKQHQFFDSVTGAEKNAMATLRCMDDYDTTVTSYLPQFLTAFSHGVVPRLASSLNTSSSGKTELHIACI